MACKTNKLGKRVDSRGRVLKTGETQLNNGRYQFSYTSKITGKREVFYSWKLEKNDPMPKNKRPDKSLREKEKELQYDEYDEIKPKGDGLTVLRLVEEYVKTRRTVRPTTQAGYKTTINHLKQDPFGKKRIDRVSVMDAKNWLIKLQDEDKKSYSSIHNIRGVVRPAFELAVQSKQIRSNPFNFQLKDLIINDSVKRESVDKADERRFLKFLEEDSVYNKMYDGAYILFNTGLRIGELCGLTFADIDLENKTLNVDHQLQSTAGKGRYIEETKTDAGKRTLPINDDVCEAFRRVIANRKAPKVEAIVDGYTGFIFLNRNGDPTLGYYWEKKFESAIEKYNKIYKNELPKITPHMCRHTYASRMAVSGVNIYTLKYLMGHSDIQTTINIYTHLGLMDARNELDRVEAQLELEKLKNKVAEAGSKVVNIADYAV